MVRLTVLVAGLTVLAGTAVGQRSAATMSPWRSMPAPVNASPYGNILFPGGTPSHASRLGATVAGAPYPGIAPPIGSGRPGRPVGSGRPQTIVVPYAVPVWTGGYGGYYDVPQQQQPNVTVVVPQQPAPSVIINHHYNSDTPLPTVTTETTTERGGLKVYEATPRAAQPAAPVASATPASLVRDDKPNIYLIALNDGTVRQAIGYWSKDGALHYVTPSANIHQISLGDIDRPATQRLNAERKLEFDLPIE